ncbi:hypothetical protein PHMEG_00011197 [Phytophthora megakarya]|uniref:Uncharacterized protein n=1 Tax=Phytophthora megakarya TaxID=4795 RepID=A0A225WDV2_9STRA|nr:hypothetical protein PHMEG_00011197 [Phytophthora megakarya]
MTIHNDKKCRRGSCRNKLCQRRRAERRQGTCSTPHVQPLLVPSVGILFQHRQRHHFPLLEPSVDMNRDKSAVTIDSLDFQAMRDSVNKMQQQLSRGLRDIQEIRVMVKRAVAQREQEKRDNMTKRSPYEFDSTLSLAVGAQRSRKKKRRDSSSDCETEANKAWLVSVLRPAQQNNLPTMQHNEVVARITSVVPEKRPVQVQMMSVEVLEQKKMLLPYLDKIEYINYNVDFCQLKRNLFRKINPHVVTLVNIDRDRVTPVKVSTRMLQTRYPRFFEAVMQIAEDILAQFKFNDDGESLSSLIRLRDTITLDSKVDKWVTLYAEQERVLRNKKIELMKMERSNINNQFRVQIRLLQNQILLQEQELQHIQKKITDGENLVNNIWKEVVAVKSPLRQLSTRGHLGDNVLLPSKELVSVLGRFEEHIGRLQKKHDIAVKASMVLAIPWQQQMEELRLRMVVKIQRAYRARKSSQETKQKAREKLSAQIREREIKLKNQELERKRLETLREKDMERHQQRLKTKREQEDKQKRILEEKQKKLVQKAREEEAGQRAVAMKKKTLSYVMEQWESFVVRKKNRRKASLLFLKFKLMKWKLHLTLHKLMTDAAKTIQHFVRERKEQAQFLKMLKLRAKRNKIAKKYLQKVHLRMVNRLFNQN